MADQILCVGQKCPHCSAMMFTEKVKDGRAVMTEEVTGSDGKPLTKSHMQCPTPYCPAKQAAPPEEDE